MKNAYVKTDRKKLKAEKREMQNAIDAIDVRALPKTKIVPSIFTTDKATHKTVPYGTLFIICLFTIAALFVTFLSVRVNEVNNEISTLNTKLAQIREQTADAKAEIFEKKDITVIRQTAERYGMVRSEYLPAHYITVETDDKVTVEGEEENEREYSFAALLSAFGDSIASFLEYIR